MKPFIVTLALAFGVAVAPAQTRSSISSHSGWSIQDTLETSPDIVVGAVATSDCADRGTLVSCRATVRVLRAIKGELAPQAKIQVHWDFKPGPLDGPEAMRHVPDATALWFLHPAADGGYTPSRATFMPAYGGVFLRVPAEAPGGDFFYTGDAAPEYKIAREVGAEMVAEGPAADAQIAAQTRFQPSAIWFLAQTLNNLPAKAATGVYASLARSPSASLEAVGISGRLRAGDAGALIELDRDLPRLANTSAVHDIAGNIPMLKLRDRPAAAQALAHLATAEIEIPLLEHFAPSLLAGTGNLEFLPVLIVMLHSPSPDVRAEALFAACALLQPRAPAQTAHCPARLREAHDMENDVQRENVRFWIEWWQTVRTRDTQLAGLRDLPVPARYSMARAPDAQSQTQSMEIPMEVRFQGLIAIVHPPTHYHTADGVLHEGDPAGGADMFTARMSAEDHAALIEVLKGVSEKMDAIDVDANKIMGEARFTGGRPDINRMHALNARRTEALKSGLTSVQSNLSPEGWAVVDGFLRDTNSHSAFGLAGPRH
jgi:hypothetical protein